MSPHVLLFFLPSFEGISLLGGSMKIYYTDGNACMPCAVFCFRYKAIVKYKTAFYSFYLPVALAMHLVSEFASA